MSKIKALIATGLGFNCEYESGKAFELAGADADIKDIRDIINGKVNIFDYHAMMLIGGFSYGDDLGSGKAIANLLRFKKINEERFIDLIKKFVEQKKVVFGICNGFQVLMKLGILPGFDNNYENQTCTIALNNSSRYEDRWINLKFNSKSKCIATKGIDSMYVPVRHGEGKIITKDNTVLERIMTNNHYFAQYIDPKTNESTMTYPMNPNGAVNAIAGLCDETGLIFGMMPHPEAFLMFENHPHWTRLKREYNEKKIELPKYGQGLKLFKNIVEYCEETFRMEKKSFTYKDTGVDINAADQNQKILKNMIKQTYSKHVIPDVKGLGSMFEIPKDIKNPILVSGTDGVGTKLKIAFMMDKHDTVGIDAVALCVNDIIRRGAKPLFFLDYLAVGKLEQNKVNEIVKGVIEGCNQANCSLIGGETAQMPEFYNDSYELAGFSVGIIDKEKMITGDNIKPGDLIIGLASSGIHSNGYTLARKVLLSKNNINDIAYDNVTIGQALLEPSRIYVKPIIDILENNNKNITGLCNITGSAFNKLKKLNSDVGFKIEKLLPIPKVFELLQKQGNITNQEMFSTFNMGIGFVIIAKNANFLDGFEEKYGYKADIIGMVDDTKKVNIIEKKVIL